jgi:hypothetical protein
MTIRAASAQQQAKPGLRPCKIRCPICEHDPSGIRFAQSGSRLLGDNEIKRPIRRERLSIMAKHRIYTMSVASVYPHYVTKVEKKGRTKTEVDEIIRWLTGYSQKELDAQLKKKTDFETFFADAPQLNSSRALIKGVICGVRVEDIEDPLMREVRYLDKLIDELAKGKTMEKILRK